MSQQAKDAASVIRIRRANNTLIDTTKGLARAEYQMHIAAAAHTLATEELYKAIQTIDAQEEE